MMDNIPVIKLGLIAVSRDCFPIALSEKRRAAIAGVIAMDPDVLILDEPTAGLDPLGRDVLLSQIQNYHKTRKNTIIFVSHSMEDIARISDRILVMNHGEKLLFDTTQNVFAKAEELEKVGLRIPQITKIMRMLKKRGINVNTNILTIEQAFNEIINYLGT